MEKYSTILVVDDDVFNLDILKTYLKKSGYKTILAEGGVSAWELLKEEPKKYSLVLLDRMMPDMDGMEVLKKIKSHPILKYVPVVMQTAASAPDQISEGISKGVYYYLTKPFNRDVLLSIVETAINEYMNYLKLKEDLDSNRVSMNNLEHAMFRFRTIEEGVHIVNLLANASPDPLQTGIGMKELIVNAVEHGNLSITYKEKGQLLTEDLWEEEIERRLQLPENREKYVYLSFKRERQEEGSCIHINIKDQGEGFDYDKYMAFSMDRLYDTHGRGILVANNSFSKLEYQDNGSSVHVWFATEKKTELEELIEDKC